MTLDQVQGVVRAVLAAAGGYLVSRGTIDAGMVEAVTGATLAVVAAVWSIMSKKPTT